MTRFFSAILSAVLLSLPFFNPCLWIFSWVALIPLFVSLEGRSLSGSFVAGFICGLFFWGLAIYWLIHVTFIGQAALVLYLAVYFGVFACAVHASGFLPPGARLFFIPCSWVILEYIRSHLFTGFPWALVAFSQYKNLPVIQLAGITGAWGVSFVLIFTNTAIYLFFRKRLKVKQFLICVCALLLLLGSGFFVLYRGRETHAGGGRLKVSVIQGNVPQDLKWDSSVAGGILNKYLRLTASAAGDNPDLIVWPEASVPFIFGEAAGAGQFERIFGLAGRLRKNLLLGAVSYSQGAYFNSALLVNGLGQPEQMYSKIHLVPFGEYVPLKEVFPFLQTITPIGEINPGRDYVVFSTPADFSVLICFEDLFPELSREFVRRGAEFLVNITNDAWYKQGSAPYQHLAASVFRAVENRVYLVRSANTGVSCFIDPWGREVATVKDGSGRDIFVQGYCTHDLRLGRGGRTFYNRYGDFFVFFCLLACAAIIGAWLFFRPAKT
jgi:apolipoprotein N-acyltransferase